MRGGAAKKSKIIILGYYIYYILNSVPSSPREAKTAMGQIYEH